MSSSLEEPPLSDSPTLPQHLSTHQSYAAHAETPSVHAGNLSPEYAGPAPHSSPLKLDSQGTAGFGPGSIQSGAAGLLPRHPERSFSRAGLPPRVISPPLSHGRMSTGGMSGDSLAHYSLVQSRGGRFSVTTPQQQNRAESPQQLLRSLSEKVRVQAERLHALDQYKLLCERRIAELAPGHPLPIGVQHLGAALPQHPGERALQAETEQLRARLAQLESALEQKQNLMALRGAGQVQQLLRDKREADAALQGEILENEELKRYVEVLKEALGAKMIQELPGSRLDQLDAYTELLKIRTQLEAMRREKAAQQERDRELAGQRKVLEERSLLATQLSAQVEELTAVSSRLQEEKATLLEFVEESLKTREAELAKLDSLKSEQQASEGREQGLQAELETKNKEVERAEQKALVEEKRQKEAIALAAEKEGLLVKAKSQVAEMAQKIEKLEVGLAEWKTKAEVAGKALSEVSAELDVRSAELAKAQESGRTQTERLERKLRLQEEAVAEAKGESEMLAARGQEEVQALERRLAGVEERYQSTRQCLYQTEKESFQRKDVAQRLDVEKAGLVRANERLEAALGRACSQLETVQARAELLEQVEQKHERAAGGLRTLEREKFALQQQVTQLEDALSAAEAQSRRARGEAERLSATAAETERARAAELNEAQTTLAEQGRQQDELIVLLGALRGQAGEKDERIRQMEAQLRIYKHELEHLHELAATATRSPSPLETTARLRDENAQLRSQMSRMTRSSPLRHGRSASETLSSASAAVLSSLNVTLEAIRGFTARMAGMNVSEGFKRVGVALAERIGQKIFVEEEKEQALARIDEWVRAAMAELERMAAAVPSLEKTKRLRREVTPPVRVESPARLGEEVEAVERELKQAKALKEQLAKLLERVIRALPGDELQEAYRRMRQSVEQAALLEEKKQGVLVKQRGAKGARLDRLQSALAQVEAEEAVERRRRAALEEELAQLQSKAELGRNTSEKKDQQVSALLAETQDMRAQLSELRTAKEGTEVLNEKLTQERRQLDKELLELRAQVIAQPGGQPPLYSTQALPPSFGGTQRDVDLLRLPLATEPSAGVRGSLPATSRSFDLLMAGPPCDEEESSLTPPKNTLQERLAQMQEAIKERLGSVNSSFQ